MWDRQDGVSLAEATGRYERGSAIAANRPCSFVRPQDRGLALVSRYLLSLPLHFRHRCDYQSTVLSSALLSTRADRGSASDFRVSTARVQRSERNLARIGRKNKNKKEKSDTIRDRNARAATKIFFTSLDRDVYSARENSRRKRAFREATSFLANERHKRGERGASVTVAIIIKSNNGVMIENKK